MTKEEIKRYATMNKFDNYQRFYDWIVGTKPHFKIFAEIGVWKGHGITYLAKKLIDTRMTTDITMHSKIDFEIYAIDLFQDLWKYKDYASRYERFHIKDIRKMYEYNLNETMTRHLIKDIKGLSNKMADKFDDEYFDFVFIDADHEYESVKADIVAWLPKVKKGGIISGHDYCASQQGVIKAVNECFRRGRKFFTGYVWYVEV